MSSQGAVDDLDMRILGGLSRDSSASVPSLARELGISVSAAYSRIRRLARRGVIDRYTISINKGSLGYRVKAHVGISMDSRRRASVVEALIRAPGVTAVAEVTGRFDALVTLHARSLGEMHDLVSGEIGGIPGVTSSESFIEMRSSTNLMPGAAAGAG